MTKTILQFKYVILLVNFNRYIWLYSFVSKWMHDITISYISEKKSFTSYDLIILWILLSHIFFLSAWIFKQTIKNSEYYCSYKNMNCTFQVSSEALNIHAMTEWPLEICPNGLNFDLFQRHQGYSPYRFSIHCRKQL